jgi:RNA polymerase sigma-70 factor (ECF subfamily)
MKEISFRNDILPLKNELFRLALRITLNHAEAEDVVQETMIKVWNRRDRWDEIESIEAFCLTICRNISLDKLKKAENQNQSLESLRVGLGTDGHDAPDRSYSSNPEEQAMQQDRIQLVRRLIDKLPEKQRSCMQLRDFEGKSYKEIAQILGISEEQVKISIFRARQTIKQKFLETEKYGL